MENAAQRDNSGNAGQWKRANGNNWKLWKSLGFFDEMNGNLEFRVWRDGLVGLSGKCGIAGVFWWKHVEIMNFEF
jgi:hypothetical protein